MALNNPVSNPGEALWNLKSFVTLLERSHSTDPGFLAMTAVMHDSCRCLADYMQIGLPENNDLAARLNYLTTLQMIANPLPQPARPVSFLPPVPSNTAPRQEQPAGPCPNLARLQAICRSILDDMDQLPDRASECRDGEEKSYAERLRELTEDVMDKTAAHQRASSKQLEMMEGRRAGMDKWLERA